MDVGTGAPVDTLDRYWATVVGCQPSDLRAGRTVLRAGLPERAQIFITSDGAVVVGPPDVLDLAVTLPLDRLLDPEMWAARLEIQPQQLASFSMSLFYATPRLFRPQKPHPFVRQLKRRDAEALARFGRILDASEPGRAQYWLVGGRTLGVPQTKLWGGYFEARLVSVAGIRRIDPNIMELGVDTLPKHRRQGYGLAVSAAASRAALRESPLLQWSTQAENVASTRLALQLGFRPYAHQLWLGPPSASKRAP